MRDYTYFAADFDHDKPALECIEYMKLIGFLQYKDAHQLQQSSDTSLPCSIKKSLKFRMDNSCVFVLIVGNQTDTVTKGGCQLCNSYNSYLQRCARGYSIDYRSYIKYECEIAAKAARDGMRIVVLYNNAVVDKKLCPEAVRYIGLHQAMWYQDSFGKYCWDYHGIARAVKGL